MYTPEGAKIEEQIKIPSITKGILHFHFIVLMLGNWDKEMNEGLSLLLERLIWKAYVKTVNKGNGISIVIKNSHGMQQFSRGEMLIQFGGEERYRSRR